MEKRTMELTRRALFRLGAFAASGLPLLSRSFGDVDSVEAAAPELKISDFNIKVGATRPFKAVHISDSHFSFGNNTDDAEQLKYEQSRAETHKNAESNFSAALDLARQDDALFINTGDTIDFFSENNCERVKDVYAKDDLPEHIICAGNHEFRIYGKKSSYTEEDKAETFDRLQAAYPNDLRFASKIVNGVNFIAFDNVYHRVTEYAIERFKAEAEKGAPIVALCHVPLHTPDLYDYRVNVQKRNFTSCMGVPVELTENFDPDRRKRELADRATFEFVDWLKELKLLKAILCGHLHFKHVSQFSETAVQYVIGANFRGEVHRFTIE